ncbi:MAG: RdgB/HAM1 family non-canonical purine NTP pyrophosphatase [Kiritimatiellia bacterium]
MQTILLATRNRKKLAELQALLADRSGTCRFVTIDDVDAQLPDVDEDGETFTANACKKALVLAQASGLLTLADDSGLAVDALGGAPGVRSARFAGEPSDDAANNALLLQKLLLVHDRSAQFHCVLALATPDGRCATVAGVCKGHLREAPSGAAGFGYDPLFVPEGYTQTFAELGADVKHRVSHRAQALRAARATWVRNGMFALPEKD